MAMLEKWENGDIIQPGTALQNQEVGTGYQKVGVDLDAFAQAINPGGGGRLNTIDLDVCVDGSPETHTFVITDAP